MSNLRTGGGAAQPVSDFMNGSPTYFRRTSVPTAGYTLLIGDAAASLKWGVTLINENGSLDGYVSRTQGSASKMLLPLASSGIAVPVFILGQGDIWVHSASGTINVSGWYL